MKTNVFQTRLPPLVAVGAMLAACTQDVNPAGPEGTGSPQLAASRTAPAPLRTMDDDFVDLVKEVPGFGGMYFDEEGRLNVHLKEPGGASAARGAIARVLARHGQGRDVAAAVASMRTHRGDYDFSELAAAYRTLRGERLEGFVFGDLDEVRNRVIVGVRDEAAARGTRSLAARLGVPEGVLVVEVHEPVRTAARLIDAVRPTVGGIQISDGLSYCTLGYNVRRFDPWTGVPSASRYFVTNSHCTDQFGGVTGQSMGQPEYWNTIGTEVVDPPMLTNHAACPAGRSCRYSDAALFVYDGAVASDFPRIANVGSGTSGSATILNTWVMNEERMPYVGNVVGKIGRTTGYSEGSVNQSCVDVAQYNPWGYDTGRTMLCQARVNNMRVQGGDSGSPAYIRANSTTRYPVGIVWGGNNSGGVISTIYHAMLEFRDAEGGNFTVAERGFFRP